MEVGSINFNLPVATNQTANHIQQQNSTIAVHNKNDIQFNSKNVMMDLTDMQEFLFMLIGHDNHPKEVNQVKNSSINLLA